MPAPASLQNKQPGPEKGQGACVAPPPQGPATAAASVVVVSFEPADASAPCGFAALPPPLVLIIFTLLPADARARVAAVCQAWRYILTVGPSSWRLWTELDLSETSGVTCKRGDAALQGAAALARGRLRMLTLRAFGTLFQPHTFTVAVLHRVLAANVRLEELAYVHVGFNFMTVEQVQALLAAAPALQQLTTLVKTADVTVARAMLRRAPPYAALRLDQLYIHDKSAASPLRATAGVTAFAADIAACESLRGMNFHHASLVRPAAMEALVDAVLTRRHRHLHLLGCHFAPAVALPQLAHLLADGRSQLRNLSAQDSPTLFENAQATDIEALCDALARSSKLSTLQLKNVGLPAGAHAFIAVLLRRALASRPAGSPAAEVTVE